VLDPNEGAVVVPNVEAAGCEPNKPLGSDGAAALVELVVLPPPKTNAGAGAGVENGFNSGAVEDEAPPLAGIPKPPEPSKDLVPFVEAAMPSGFFGVKEGVELEEAPN